MARDCKDDREEPSNSEREREGPKMSVSDRVMVRDREWDRVMAINS